MIRRRKVKLVTTLDEAYVVIVQKAIDQVLALDFGDLPFEPENAREILEIAVPIILRNSGCAFPFNMMVEGKEPDSQILAQLPNSRKRREVEGYWLVLSRFLTPEDVEFIYAWVFLKLIEMVSVAMKGSAEQYVKAAMLGNGSELVRANTIFVMSKLDEWLDRTSIVDIV